jgi:hypothetical protein
LLPDGLLRDLMAAGQADILVGIPTLNHVQTVGRVARTVNDLFTGQFARQRTVLINPDGGSTDGTQAAVMGSGAASGDLVVTSFALRTLHQISTPYHGVPGRGSAMRLIFAAADLLNVRAVAVISPESTDLTQEDIGAMLSAVLDAGADYVKPVLPRAADEGPLVTQLVRPLLGAVFGAPLFEPVDPLLACSRGFARRALQSDLWDTPFTQYGLDPWLGAIAALDGFQMAQARVHAQHTSVYPRPEFREVFQQVVGSVFSVITRDAQRWLPLTQSREIPIYGQPFPPASSGGRFDATEFAAALRDGVDALGPLLAEVLRESTLTALSAAARAERPEIDDALWVRTVYDLVASAGRGRLPLDQLVQALQPLYLGRLATMLEQLAAGRLAATDPHAQLARVFEELKPELVTAWPASQAG